jgi:hypothetical protein
VFTKEVSRTYSPSGMQLHSTNSALHDVKKQKCPITDLDMPLEFQEVDAPGISRKLAPEFGRFLSHKYRPHLRLSKYSWYSFLLEVESHLGP